MLYYIQWGWWAQFHNDLVRLNFNPKYSRQNYTFFSVKLIRNVKIWIYSLPMHTLKYMLYLLEQHRYSFEIWWAIILDLHWGLGCGLAQWVARLTRNMEVVGSSPITGPSCFLEQETLPLLLSTGWFQERIRAWFHNRTKINWGPYGRFT